MRAPPQAYKPETYAEHRKKSALSDAVLTSDDGTTDDAADAPRPPRPPAHDERGAASGNESEGQDRAAGAGDYASDPGTRKKKKAGSQSKGARVHMSESHDTLEKLMRPPPPKRKRSTTKKEPFSFENRIPNPSTRALRLQVERMEAQEQERLQLQIAKRSFPRAVPACPPRIAYVCVNRRVARRRVRACVCKYVEEGAGG